MEKNLICTDQSGLRNNLSTWPCLGFKSDFSAFVRVRLSFLVLLVFQFFFLPTPPIGPQRAEGGQENRQPEAPQKNAKNYQPHERSLLPPEVDQNQ